MRYKKVLIFGHPRSGSHYVTSLIAMNFFNTDNYLSFYGGHGFNFEYMEKRIMSKKNTLFINVNRKSNSVLKSIFNLRSRFGLNINNFNDFINTKYSEMFDDKLKVNVIRKTLTDCKLLTTVDPLFRKINMNPEEFYIYYHNVWINFYSNYNNIIRINYDVLLYNFQQVMSVLAKYFGNCKDTFINVNSKIGWMDNG